MNKISIIIPCHNEEKGIGKVIDNVPVERLKSLNYVTEIVVINNKCTDKTEAIARKRNARVIREGKKGKGNAIKAGFDALSEDTTYVVMLDGDSTYDSSEIPRLIEPLESGFCDVIVGSRLGGKMKKNSFKFSNRVANWGYTFLVRHFYRANITDVLSGYFAWKKNVVDELRPHLESDGFAIEMEMITKMVKFGYDIYSVPITYEEREGETKINSLKDGVRILRMFFDNFFWTVEKKSYQKNTDGEFAPGLVPQSE